MGPGWRLLGMPDAGRCRPGVVKIGRCGPEGDRSRGGLPRSGEIMPVR